MDFTRDGLASVVCMVAVFVGGCVSVSPPSLEYAVDGRPEFLVVYHPYDRGLSRTVAEPKPNYRGWPYERMERDLERMWQAGVGVLLLTLDADRALDSVRVGSYNRLFELALGRDRGPKIAFWLYRSSEGGDCGEVIDAFIRWHIGSGLGRSAAHFRVDGRPLVVLGQGFDAFVGNHPALTLRRTGGVGARWTRRLTTDVGEAVVCGDKRQVIVSALSPRRDGAPTSSKELLRRRRRGMALRDALWAAFRAQAGMICVSSWNDFESGDFTEPNSLDERRMYQVLTEEIARARRHLPGD